MITVSLTQARARLSHLLDKVESGQDVAITRRGKVVAHLSPASPSARPKKKPLQVKRLAEFRAKMPPLDRPSVELIREMRDEKY